MRRMLSVALLVAACVVGLAGCVAAETGGNTGTTVTNQPEWRVRMAQVPLPSHGCFKAVYPSVQWHSVACTAAPKYPQPPRHGFGPAPVGNGDDISAHVPSGFIGTAIGSFPNVTGVTSESGPIGNSGPSIANAYTLQMNMNFFTSTACAGSPNPGCQGWEQIVFWNDGSSAGAFIQYWLIQYNATCPGGVGWNQFSFTGSSQIYCWKNDNMGAVPVPNQPITNLGNLSLSGAVTASSDGLTFSDGGTTYAVTGDNAVNAAAGWQTAEFNVFGAGGNSAGGGTASFNSGASVVPKVRVLYGGTAAPVCVVQGFTAEMNNLGFGPGAPAVAAPGPALGFTESTAGTTPGNCADATGIGDTHLTTFSGTYYDFQATGDFLLTRTSDFAVQARQVSGAPSWPNAAINQAAATQMGATRVAVCGPQFPLLVDGKAVDLPDGQFLQTLGGVTISRAGNVYLVIDANGNSMRAEVNNPYINVTVGLGTWPVAVKGLLANPNGNASQLAASDGTVLNTPVAFTDLYGHYGESWRVAPTSSLLNDCGSPARENGVPSKPFFSRDLDPNLAGRARTICTGVGVKDLTLLDACILDVTVLGSDKAAAVYVGSPTPVVVGEQGQPGQQG